MPDPGCPGNHWVAVILDRMSWSIWLGDSLGCRPDATLIEMLHWWLRPAFEESFKVRSLRSNKQMGSWSCGDRAVNMMANHFLPDEFPLIGGTDEEALWTRIELLVRLIGEIRTLVYPLPRPRYIFTNGSISLARLRVSGINSLHLIRNHLQTPNYLSLKQCLVCDSTLNHVSLYHSSNHITGLLIVKPLISLKANFLRPTEPIMLNQDLEAAHDCLAAPTFPLFYARDFTTVGTEGFHRLPSHR